MDKESYTISLRLGLTFDAILNEDFTFTLNSQFAWVIPVKNCGIINSRTSNSFGNSSKYPTTV